MSHSSENLSAYLDGELSDSEARALEAQLAQDPTLMAELNELKDVQDYIRSHGPIQAPPGFYAKVLSTVEQEPIQASWWSWLSRPFGLPVQGLAVAAVAALVLLLAIPFGAQQLVFNTAGDKLSKDESKLASSSSYGRTSEDPRKEVAGKTRSKPTEEIAAQGSEDSDGKRDLKGPPTEDRIQEMLNTSPDQYTVDDMANEQNLPSGSAEGEGLKGWTGSDKQPSKEESSKKKESVPIKSLGASGFVYTIQTDDPEVLYNLFKLVKRYKGSLRDGQGRALSPMQLSADQAMDVVVWIDEKNLNSLDRQLLNLYPGATKTAPETMELNSGSTRRVKIKLRVSGEASAPGGVQYQSDIPAQKPTQTNKKQKR